MCLSVLCVCVQLCQKVERECTRGVATLLNSNVNTFFLSNVHYTHNLLKRVVLIS